MAFLLYCLGTETILESHQADPTDLLSAGSPDGGKLAAAQYPGSGGVGCALGSGGHRPSYGPGCRRRSIIGDRYALLIRVPTIGIVTSGYRIPTRRARHRDSHVVIVKEDRGGSVSLGERVNLFSS